MHTSIENSLGRENEAAKQLWPVEHKVAVVLEGLLRHRSVAELCREAGISPSRYYQWRQEVIDAARIALVHPEVERRTMEERIRQLEAENASLRRRARIFQELCVAD